MKQGKKWYSLDNSSKIFPATTSDGRKNTFFLSAVLKEEVNKEILEQAVNEVLKRFPSFCVRLKRGMFWYYLEENTKPFKLTEENANFLETFDEKENKNQRSRCCPEPKPRRRRGNYRLSDADGCVHVPAHDLRGVPGV